MCEPEPRNSTDRYAVAVKKDGIIIGHLPTKISRVCSLFLRRGGVIRCTVSATRRYSMDLPQGGLEILCVVKFIANAKEIHKLKLLINTVSKLVLMCYKLLSSFVICIHLQDIV